jgi:CRISPR/Cas system CSM-associated protein Csm3 (group 7 of RAMP superfamily)
VGGSKYLVIELEMETLSPLFSGEIKAERASRSPRPVRITGTGKVAVPIYGALRGYLEVMLRKQGRQVCDTGQKGAKPCGRCVLCALFGSLQRKGRAIIDDLVSVDDYKKIVSESVHLRINRETGTVSDTLRMEEVKEGAKFVGKIRIIDPTEEDKKLILAGLKAIEEFGLGGWVTRGRGRVKFTKIEFKEKSWEDFLKEAEKELKKLEAGK